jgi:hypothetical protein
VASSIKLAPLAPEPPPVAEAPLSEGVPAPAGDVDVGPAALASDESVEVVGSLGTLGSLPLPGSPAG